jgi:hypothetical protein
MSSNEANPALYADRTEAQWLQLALHFPEERRPVALYPRFVSQETMATLRAACPLLPVGEEDRWFAHLTPPTASETSPSSVQLTFFRAQTAIPIYTATYTLRPAPDPTQPSDWQVTEAFVNARPGNYSPRDDGDEAHIFAYLIRALLLREPDVPLPVPGNLRKAPAQFVAMFVRSLIGAQGRLLNTRPDATGSS